MLEPKEYENVLISSFTQTGSPIYAYHQGSHIYWDIYYWPDCLYPKEKEANRPSHRRSKVKKSIKQRYKGRDPTVGPLSEPSGKFDYLVNYLAPTKKNQLESVPMPPIPCRSLDLDSKRDLASPPLPAIAMFKSL